MSKYSVSDEEFIKIVKESQSYTDALRSMGMAIAGGNHASIRKRIKLLNLDISHFKGRNWSLGKTFPNKQRPIEDYLSNKVEIQSNSLKLKLFKLGMLENKCYICGLIDWQGQKISLELDHINGQHHDNTLTNLRILCPNCHSQTDTFRNVSRDGRRKQREPRKIKPILIDASVKVDKEPIRIKRDKKHCKCGKTINYRSEFCKSCRPVKQKIDWPAPEVLIERLATTNYLALGEELGVSDNAIRKYLKGRGFTLPRGWTNPRTVKP